MASALLARSPTVVPAAPVVVVFSALGTSASFRRNIATVPKGFSIASAKLTCSTTIALDPADYWTFSITSTGGTVPLTGSKATTTVLTAGTLYSLTGLAAGQALAADTMLELNYVKAGNGADQSASNLHVTVWLQPA